MYIRQPNWVSDTPDSFDDSKIEDIKLCGECHGFDYPGQCHCRLRKLVDDMRATIHSESCGCNGCEMLREYAGKFEKQLLDGGE